MSRVKGGATSHARHRKVIKQAAGYYGARSTNYRTAKQAVEKALQYNYRDRRNKKRDFRRLWITRISAACRLNGLTYNRFIEGLNKGGISIDRKSLAEIAATDAGAFTVLVSAASAAVQIAQAQIPGAVCYGRWHWPFTGQIISTPQPRIHTIFRSG